MIADPDATLKRDRSTLEVAVGGLAAQPAVASAQTVEVPCGSGWAVPAGVVGWSEPGNQARGGDTW
jgi:hypothetical protein